MEITKASFGYELSSWNDFNSANVGAGGVESGVWM